VFHPGGESILPCGLFGLSLNDPPPRATKSFLPLLARRGSAFGLPFSVEANFFCPFPSPRSRPYPFLLSPPPFLRGTEQHHPFLNVSWTPLLGGQQPRSRFFLFWRCGQAPPPPTPTRPNGSLFFLSLYALSCGFLFR